jgi:hypothetical protein
LKGFLHVQGNHRRAQAVEEHHHVGQKNGDAHKVTVAPGLGHIKLLVHATVFGLPPRQTVNSAIMTITPTPLTHMLGAMSAPDAANKLSRCHQAKSNSNQPRKPLGHFTPA